MYVFKMNMRNCTPWGFRATSFETNPCGEGIPCPFEHWATYATCIPKQDQNQKDPIRSISSLVMLSQCMSQHVPTTFQDHSEIASKLPSMPWSIMPFRILFVLRYCHSFHWRARQPSISPLCEIRRAGGPGGHPRLGLRPSQIIDRWDDNVL